MWFWKFMCPAKIFTCPVNICTSPIKLKYTAGKISTCPEWKITCPVGHLHNHKNLCALRQDLHAPGMRHALMSSSEVLNKPQLCYDLNQWWPGSLMSIIPAWISNHMHSKVWDQITLPSSNFNGTAVEVWKCGRQMCMTLYMYHIPLSLGTSTWHQSRRPF